MLKKASKRLVWSIIALVASLILCIGVCLAWFAMNQEVYGEGLHTNLHSKDIVSFKVTAYYLNETSTGSNTFSKATSGNDANIKDLQGKPLTVDNNSDGEINATGGKDFMRPFSLDNKYTTAVLYKIDYILSKDTNTNKKFRIFAECPTTSRINVIKPDPKVDRFTSDLSNAVRFFNASVNNSVYTPAAGDGDAFTALGTDKQLREKKFRLNFYDKANDTITLSDKSNFTEITAANGKNFGDDNKEFIGDFGGTKYVMMDYGSDRFAYLASLMLENDGSLSSALTLTGDITLGMEEYTANEPAAVPKMIEVDRVSYATDAELNEAFTQPIGSDIMSNKWRFVVTYSDDSQKVIRGNNDNLSFTLDTSSAGNNKSVTVSYTEKRTEGGTEVSTTVSCDVPYTVNPVIIGGTGVAVGGKLTLSVITNTNGTAVDGTKATWKLPDGTTIASIESSTDTTVTIKGEVAGDVTVTAEVTIGSTSFTVTSDITVAGTNVPVTGVSLDITTATIAVGGTETLTATVNPTNATNKEVTWLSSDDTVATYENKGALNIVKVTGKKVGTAIITVTTKDGSKTATCKVTVEAPVAVESVTLDKTSATLKVGETVTLKESIEPENAANKTVTWTSSDDTVAKVENGKVTALKAGSATITVTTADGNKTDTCRVTVEEVHTVTFNLNYDGATGAPAAQTVVNGNSATKPDNPTREGYLFGGWFTEAACTNEFNFSTKITKATTLYAKWTENAGTLQSYRAGDSLTGTHFSLVLNNLIKNARDCNEITLGGTKFSKAQANSSNVEAMTNVVTITNKTTSVLKLKIYISVGDSGFSSNRTAKISCTGLASDVEIKSRADEQIPIEISIAAGQSASVNVTFTGSKGTVWLFGIDAVE